MLEDFSKNEGAGRSHFTPLPTSINVEQPARDEATQTLVPHLLAVRHTLKFSGGLTHSKPAWLGPGFRANFVKAALIPHPASKSTASRD